jgi:hypothetical protein
MRTYTIILVQWRADRSHERHWVNGGRHAVIAKVHFEVEVGP